MFATESSIEVHFNFQDEVCGIVNLSVGNDVAHKILISLSLSAKKYEVIKNKLIQNCAEHNVSNCNAFTFPNLLKLV